MQVRIVIGWGARPHPVPDDASRGGRGERRREGPGPGHGHVKHGLRARRRSEARRTALPGEPREGAHQEEDPVIRDLLWQP